MAYMYSSGPTDSPGRYGQHIVILREMGWSWNQLCEAPSDLVDELMMHIAYQRKWENKRLEMDRQKAKHGKQY